MKKSTITDLPKEIEVLIPEAERTILINQILTEARAGEFHDFKSNKYAAGKHQVVLMMRNTNDARLISIIQAVMNGDYDESPDDNDKIMFIKSFVADTSNAMTAYQMMKVVSGTVCPKCHAADFLAIVDTDGYGCNAHKSECPYFKHK